ncbi:MAG: hypothetical protein K9N09_10405 [Candidatus Cloacimonetes bacterium]|nr:hypothetical protein [Candidatus Cloacimonadota bacterium]MCF7814590.1 hypothetical protein [Candidatus Cloacimonadota bacterium]MCF7869103.1 hypothetical protein [Candidatus Cloacimonadota bacterium]MCF7884520.1 hypothetical protein [Candidatus Cloacimonadota bacterium]
MKFILSVFLIFITLSINAILTDADIDNSKLPEGATEVVEKRTDYCRTYKLPDGRYETIYTLMSANEKADNQRGDELQNYNLDEITSIKVFDSNGWHYTYDWDESYQGIGCNEEGAISSYPFLCDCYLAREYYYLDSYAVPFAHVYDSLKVNPEFYNDFDISDNVQIRINYNIDPDDYLANEFWPTFFTGDLEWEDNPLDIEPKMYYDQADIFDAFIDHTEPWGFAIRKHHEWTMSNYIGDTTSVDRVLKMV